MMSLFRIFLWPTKYRIRQNYLWLKVLLPGWGSLFLYFMQLTWARFRLRRALRWVFLYDIHGHVLRVQKLLFLRLEGSAGHLFAQACSDVNIGIIIWNREDLLVFALSGLNVSLDLLMAEAAHYVLPRHYLSLDFLDATLFAPCDLLVSSHLPLELFVVLVGYLRFLFWIVAYLMKHVFHRSIRFTHRHTAHPKI